MSPPPPLFAVIRINRATKREMTRLDLAPMNHAAACNFMDSCRTEYTDYRLTPWPEATPHPAPPMYADAYRRDQDKLPTHD